MAKPLLRVAFAVKVLSPFFLRSAADISLLEPPYSAMVMWGAIAVYVAPLTTVISLALMTPIRLSMAPEKTSLSSEVLSVCTLSF